MTDSGRPKLTAEHELVIRWRSVAGLPIEEVATVATAAILELHGVRSRPGNDDPYVEFDGATLVTKINEPIVDSHLESMTVTRSYEIEREEKDSRDDFPGSD